jgi:SAM-dependent methyltransferase
MSNISIDYGNWVPKKIIYTLLIFVIVISTLSIIPMLSIFNVILWILDGFFIVGLLFLFYLYRIFAHNNGEMQIKLRNIVLQNLPWNGKGKVLDIGTGSGYLAIQLAKTNPNTEAWGIDYWGKGWNYSLKMCEENAKIEGVMDRTKFQKVNASDLPFNNEEFDAIVSNFVFHEVRSVKDKFLLFKEALRVLKKGGVFSIQDLIKKEKHFGELNELNEKLRKLGVEEVNYIDTLEELNMPTIARVAFRNSGIIFGRK